MIVMETYKVPTLRLKAQRDTDRRIEFVDMCDVDAKCLQRTSAFLSFFFLGGGGGGNLTYQTLRGKAQSGRRMGAGGGGRR